MHIGRNAPGQETGGSDRRRRDRARTFGGVDRPAWHLAAVIAGELADARRRPAAGPTAGGGGAGRQVVGAGQVEERR